jgi:hypothetical protein
VTVHTPMRWKLIILTSFLGAFFTGGAWCLLTIVGFGQSGILLSHPLIALSSLLIPLLLSIFAAIFVYRHTARRRKTQALITMVLTLLLTLGVYVTMMRFYQRRLSVAALPLPQPAAVCSCINPNPISFCTGFSDSITNRM